MLRSFANKMKTWSSNSKIKRKFPKNSKLNWLKIFYCEDNMSIKVKLNILKHKIHLDF